MRPSLIAAWLLLAAPPASSEELALAVPSPDWRDQVIYFLMIDRFDDADPANNRQGKDEYAPADGARYSGGDLAGITRRLDYIQGLGATAIWITPPNAHLWWDPIKNYGGYHGYWGADFASVDPHFGDLLSYQKLADALHRKGMFLIQDIVVNHTGNYFHCGKEGSPEQACSVHPDPVGAPLVFPFTQNDARKAAHRQAGIYHWTPEIEDFANPIQVESWQLAGLDDLDTDNAVVRETLRKSFGHWISAVGVDGYRVDTAFYVRPEFFEDFLYSKSEKAPGIDLVARANGREQFHVFGEGFAVDQAFEETQARRIDTYMRGPAGEKRMPGMLDFPLYGSLAEVFGRGRATAELGYRIESRQRVHAQPQLMPTFIDNHDVDRLLAGADRRALELSLLAIMTLPGIPTIYYGTEQGLTEQRAAMFDGGFKAKPGGHFDTSAPLYAYIARIAKLRRENRVFSRGSAAVLRSDAAGPGALVYAMKGFSREAKQTDAFALVMFNTASHPVLVDNLELFHPRSETGLAAGTQLRGEFGVDQKPVALAVDEGGRVSVELPPRSGQVWVAGGSETVSTRASALTIDAVRKREADGELAAHGKAAPGQRFQLVVNGNLDHALTVTADRKGRWRVPRIDTSTLLDPAVDHRLVAWDPVSLTASPARSFRAEREWKLLAEVADPVGDDHGPEETYRYPTDASFNHQLDLTGARVYGSDGALRIEIGMRELSRSWNPPNGFDHVAFSIFLDLPTVAGGARAMPFQNASVPDGMRWDRRIRVHGWSNALFSSEGASATNDGIAITPAAQITVDRDKNTVSLLIPASSLGNPKTLAGLKLYLTTWDYDGGYKALSDGTESHGFSGGDGKVDPLVMDEIVVGIGD